MNSRILSLLALSLAEDDMGLYPAKVIGGDKPYDKRTDYMEGWNAYATELIDKAGRIEGWIESIPGTAQQMLLDEVIQASVRKDGIKLWVPCNDLFYWACADCEEITVDELSTLNLALAESPNHGGLLWAARKRGMRPQAAYYRHFTESEVVLFDAAGPERSDTDGKRKDAPPPNPTPKEDARG